MPTGLHFLYLTISSGVFSFNIFMFRHILLLVSLALPVFSGSMLFSAPLRPLAQQHILVDYSPAPKNIPMYTPSILSLPTGRLIAAYERSGESNKARICTSDDGGVTWIERTRLTMTHARLFRAGDAIYYLGHSGNLRIIRSDDNGSTWSSPVQLTTGQSWHQSACNVWYKDGYVYLVMERNLDSDITAWAVGALAPILMRARETDDLTKFSSWTLADPIIFGDIILGYKENTPQTGPFAVPFFTQAYPGRNPITSGRSMSPMGWLETNVVQVCAEEHPWYDPEMKTFYLLMRAHTGGTGYAAVAKVTENADGSMTSSLVDAPEEGCMLYLPMPGGQMRFHILYDKITELYWLLGSQATDSMCRAEKLGKLRYDLPNNERHRLVLHFSSDLLHWQFAGIVAIGSSPKESRHYASMDIDGEDLVILSRSGDAQAKSAHNGNMITFHRVKNFRNLIY